MRPFGYLVVGILAWGVLAFGGVYPWAYWPLAAAAFLLGLYAIVHYRAWGDWRIRRLALLLAAIDVALLLQMVPLPLDLFRALSPSGESILSQYRLAHAAGSGTLRPLSLDPAATLVAVVLFSAFAVLLVGLARAVRYMDLGWLVTHLMGLGVGLAVFGIIQKAANAATDDVLIYGFWEPQYAGTPFGPFVNRNHFAGWMVMTLPLVVGHALGLFEQLPRPRQSGLRGWLRWLAAPDAGRFGLEVFAALAMGIAIVLTGSRSGLGSFAVALLVLGIFLVRRFGHLSHRAVAVASLTAVFAGALLWAGTEAVFARLQQVPVEIQDRLAVWTDTLRIIGDFPLAGVGFGAYGMVMAIYQSAGRHTLFVQAHNDYLQIAAEGGLLVSIPAIVALVWIVLAIRRRVRSGEDSPAVRWLRVGAVAGLCGIAAQSLVEFSLQKPGNTVLFVLLLAVALHRPRAERR